MATNKARGIYMLTIELQPESAPAVYFRAIAQHANETNTPEAVLSESQVRALLQHAYGGEQMIVDQLYADMQSGEPIKLQATSKDPLLLTSHELVRFGFNPDDFDLS